MADRCTNQRRSRDLGRALRGVRKIQQAPNLRDTARREFKYRPADKYCPLPPPSPAAPAAAGDVFGKSRRSGATETALGAPNASAMFSHSCLECSFPNVKSPAAYSISLLYINIGHINRAVYRAID